MSSMVSLVPMDKAVAADETGVVANVVELILQWLVELIFSNGCLISNSYIGWSSWFRSNAPPCPVGEPVHTGLPAGTRPAAKTCHKSTCWPGSPTTPIEHHTTTIPFSGMASLAWSTTSSTTSSSASKMS